MKFGLNWLKNGDEIARLIKILPELEKLAEVLPKLEQLADLKGIDNLAENLPILEELAAKYKTQRVKTEKKEESEVKKSTFIRSFSPRPKDGR